MAPHGRAQFSALTEPELKGAFNNLGRPDKLQAQSVDARQDPKSGWRHGFTKSCMMKHQLIHQYFNHDSIVKKPLFPARNYDELAFLVAKFQRSLHH
jgi:hypothetical protein